MLILMLFISLALGLLLSRVFLNRFARPIQELSGRIHNLAIGNPMPGRELSTSNAEIQRIADNIEIIVKDIAHREEKRKNAEYLSFHDSMTGLYNRRFFEEALVRLDTRRSYPLCLLCCDVNGLKLVNDVFGHALGDRLLITVAECLLKSLRTEDVLARMGGDEFSIILPCTTENDIQQIIARIKSKLSSGNLCGAEVSVSFGYAIKHSAEQCLDQVIRAADELMYQHKTFESAQMKEKTATNIVTAAQQEGLVQEPSEKEEQLLHYFSSTLCSESAELLFESYRLRKLGRCTLLLSPECNTGTLNKHHTETGYRILSVVDSYRNVAACILHYQEHWDGTGWPSGLTGLDIPLLSRIIAVIEAFTELGMCHVSEKSGIWYDQKLVELLKDYWD